LQKQIWTINNLLLWTINFFKRKNISNPRLSAELLLSFVLGLSRMELYLHYDLIPDEKQLKKYRELISRRLTNVPIQYLTNEAYFRKLKLFVDEHVLIPRPETELVVDEAIKKINELFFIKKSAKVLEVGIGSGAISLSLLSEILNENPKREIEIVATDKSLDAIEIAKKNAQDVLKGDFFDKLKIINCDIVPTNDPEFDKDYLNSFDIVISNPPYISESNFDNLPDEVKKYEPREALVAGQEGTEVYSLILDKIKPYINKKKSFVIFETDVLTFNKLKKICEIKFINASIQITKDYNGLERILTISIG